MAICPLRLAFLITLFLTALAAGNSCAELTHFSRRALVDAGSSLTLGVMPRFLHKNQTAGRSPQQPGSLPRCRTPHVPRPHCRPSPPRLHLHPPFHFCLPSCRSPELLGGAGRFHGRRSGLGHPRP